MEDERPRDARRYRREIDAGDDFGQADYSGDYAYDPARRTAHRAAEEAARRGEDYGQADFSEDYAYDPERGSGYRRYSEDDRDFGRAVSDRAYDRRIDDRDYRPGGPPSRSWRDRASDFFYGREEPGRRRRRGPSDRVLWAVIVERLEDERGLDLRDVEVLVEDAEVTLVGTVRSKAERRRIEDIADLDAVRHVQNNLRVRSRRWF
jgi:hypothetical protein